MVYGSVVPCGPACVRIVILVENEDGRLRDGTDKRKVTDFLIGRSKGARWTPILKPLRSGMNILIKNILQVY